MPNSSVKIFFNHTTMKYDVVLLRGKISDVLETFDTERQATVYLNNITGTGRNISIYLTDVMINEVKICVDGGSLSSKIRKCIEYYIENH